MEETTTSKLIVFDASKRELFNIGKGLKSMNKKLRSSWKVVRYGEFQNNNLLRNVAYHNAEIVYTCCYAVMIYISLRK